MAIIDELPDIEMPECSLRENSREKQLSGENYLRRELSPEIWKIIGRNIAFLPNLVEIPNFGRGWGLWDIQFWGLISYQKNLKGVQLASYR